MKNLLILFSVLVIVFGFWNCSDEPVSVPTDNSDSETLLLKSGPSANGQGALIMPWGTISHFPFMQGILTG